jgi:hypothetical protein
MARGTEAQGLSGGHSRTDAEGPGGVGGQDDHATLFRSCSHDERLAFEGGIQDLLDDATRMVRVRCAADVSLLVPRWMPQVVVQREGVAEARMW